MKMSEHAWICYICNTTVSCYSEEDIREHLCMHISQLSAVMKGMNKRLEKLEANINRMP